MDRAAERMHRLRIAHHVWTIRPQIGKGYINPEDAELNTPKSLPVGTEDKE